MASKEVLIGRLEAALGTLINPTCGDLYAAAKALVGAGWTQPDPVTPPAPSSHGIGTYWINWNNETLTDRALEVEAKRRKFVLLNAWQGDVARKLKRFNPDLVVLVYKDASSARAYDVEHAAALQPTGVRFDWANRNRPDWFLLDTKGKRMQYSGYDGHWQLDVGNRAYRETWAANVIEGSKGTFDGVLVDNLLWKRDNYHDGVYPARYLTDEAFRAAYRGFLETVGTRLRAAGLKVFGNLANARLIPGGWAEYMAHLDGGWDEYWLAFTDNNLLPEYAEGWRRQTGEIAANEAAGKWTLVQPHHSPGPEGDRAFRYALASYLCVAGPRSAITSIGIRDDYAKPSPWRPEYDLDLGTPLGSYVEVTRNVFRRTYTKGVAVVNANPSDAAPQTVPLDGRYADEGTEKITPVTSVWLPPLTGVVLWKIA